MLRKSFKDSVPWSAFQFVFLLLVLESASANKEGYYGKFIGKLSQLHHGVSGDVFAVDARTLHLRNFNYDGEGPAAYFYAGSSKAPGAGGFRVRDERGTTNVLPRYRNKHITITLPEGQTLQNIRWFSVWCDEFSVNFGDVKIPKNLDFPKPQKINGLSGVHGVSSEPIVIVDAQTLLVPSFSYDGEAPDAKFWVGRGFKPSPQGIRIPDENGKEVPLRRYDRKTIVLTLPGDLTIFDIGHFGVWCEAFTVDFGHVQIPRGLNIPPSLKMLGVSPQSKLNCEVLWDDFAYEVRWAVAGDSIVLQLVARLENNEYMSFGISGDKGRSRMVGGDVVVAWVDKESLKGYAMDYYLDAKSQCSGGRGSCPDENIIPGTDSVRLLNAALVNGYSIVTYQRSLKDQDELDKPVLTNGSQPIIWAIGPLNSRKEVSYHTLANRGDIFIDFGRSPKWNCPTPESASEQTESEDAADADREYVEAKLQDARSQLQDAGRRESRPKTTIPTPAPAPKTDAWEIPAIKCYEPEDGVFYAQMGPTGGKHGYSAITGHVGWGISWYINGLLIPEINVVRGRTYTFIVEGGLDPETPARYHPFYITDDPVGGYQYKTPQERANIQIFAGAVQNKRGEVRPTGVGRLCNWTPDPNQPPADEFSSFGAYQRTLRLECDPGNPGIIQWTVDKDTPDTVYYQCYTHRYLGWKINVHDHCEGEAAASDPVPSIVKAPSHILKPQETDSESSESVNYEVRVKPDDKFLENLFEKNQTFGFNEFVGHKHRPEFLLLQENEKIIPTGGNPQKVKPEEPLTNPNSNYQVIENFNTEIPHSYAFHIPHAFPQHGQNEWLLHRQVINNSEVNIFGNKLPNYSKVPNLPVYGVRENPTEGNTQQVFQNFQIVPAIATLPSLLPAKGFQNYMIKTSPLPQEIQFAIPTIHIPEKNENPSQLPKFYQNLNEQKEEKIKKVVQKFEGNPKHTKGQSLSLTNRQRRPQPPQMLTFNGQQRPMSPGAFRPPRPLLVSHKPLKLPSSISHQKPHHPSFLSKIPSYPHRPGSGVDPEEFKNKEFKKTQQLKLQHYNHKQQQGPTFTQEARPSNLFSVTVANQQNPKELPFARNSGFDPESVQVEGGFKPILNSGIAPKFGVQPIDRIDVEAEDDIGGNTGAADQVTKDHSRNLLRHAQDKTYANPEEGEDKREENQDRTYFESKNTKQIYGKIRSEGNLRPRHVVSPFQDGVFQKRNEQQRQSELELTKVNNVTLARGEGAKNIFEVMKGFEEDANSTPQKKSSPAEDADEIAMADERKDFYLPPKPDQFLSYDGKLVKADLAPSLPAAGRVTDVSKLPQFVPFRGAVPPLDQTVNVKNLPQLRTSKLARHDILPPSQIGQARASKRQLDNKEDISKGWLNSQGDEVQRRLPGERSKRSPDHIPGHEGHHHDHDHDHDHDHGDHHNHHVHSSSSTTAANLSIIGLLSVIFPFVQFHVLL